MPGKLRVVVVAITVYEFLIESARHPRIVFFFRHPPAPIKSGWNFRGIGIKRNLVLKSLARIFGSSLPKVQPGRLPMRIGRACALRKPLLQLAKVVDGVIVVPLQQIHVSGGKQRLLEPWTRGTELPQFVHGFKHSIFVARRAGRLAQQIEPLGFGIAFERPNRSEKVPRIMAAPALFERRSQGQLQFDALCRRGTSFTSSR